MIATQLEADILRLGTTIINADRSSFWQALRLDDKLMNWAMEQEELRVRLFQLIDCLPSLQSNREIARHLQEYLSSFSHLQSLLNFNLDSPAAAIAANTFATAVSALARRYICGENLREALQTIDRLHKEGMAFTIDILGEAVISQREAELYLQKYLDLMEELRSRLAGEIQVSVKLTAFYANFDPLAPQETKERVSVPIRTLLRRAGQLNCAVHFDMEQYQYKDLTLAILQDICGEEEFRHRSDIGFTLQAYLRDSERDLYNLLAWVKDRGTPITLRLIKGAYWDQETIKAYQQGWTAPVFDAKAETDANFEKLLTILLEHNQYIKAAIGSHNVRSLAKAIVLKEKLGVPHDRFEVQALYGMGEQYMKAIAKMGHRVRIYCPYGELIPGMSYLIRRLLENTANSSFLRQSTKEKRPIEELLAPPAPIATLAQPKVVTFDHFSNTPNTDYTQAAARQKQQEAIAKVKQLFKQTYLPLINGQPVETKEYSPSVNPSRYEEIVGMVGMASLEQTDRALAVAQKAFKDWKHTPVQERADILRRCADIMEQKRYELSAWVMWEVGKPIREADAEVSEAIDFCRYYAKEMEKLNRPLTRNVPGEENLYLYQPRGIAVVISPWNFPLAIAMGMCSAALVAGNTVILKPATQSAVVAAQIAQVLQAAGLPPGVFTYLPGKGAEIGSYLVRHPAVHLYAFTGSQEVGCSIYAEAAVLRPGQRHLKRVVAEMGGKNAIIIDESADLDQAVVGVVHSAFGYSGQKCSACSRAIVLETIYDRFLERLIAATQTLIVGEAHLPSTQVGPVIDAHSQGKIQSYIAMAAKAITAAPVPDFGYYISPTIVPDLDPASPIAQEEIFGPVLGVIKASSFERALEIANNTAYALTGGLYSRTPSHIQRAKTDFEVGNLYINRGITGALVDRHPFGGFKLSGTGTKAGGKDYLLHFLEPRAISENLQRQGFAEISLES
ncbi:MAG: L-glutamate gamma-semialdehyde dehydrogenase [Pseudanabaenaceae cyanobacterium SKYGB_i_bin29]|nr:L-glutamate gamma-semialdehyde dehydrogenase [Pseudanabaenaceae cyanobacterium SKYG29]MDW8422628.1 L-glutamate gamma-semialdehyde dehydrogenase [Pseudanabaenaceae cyanobacterium SKYGB_i_bin29]